MACPWHSCELPAQWTADQWAADLGDPLLLSQTVYVFQIEVLTVALPPSMAKRATKIKVRSRGVTHFKSKARRVMPACGSAIAMIQRSFAGSDTLKGEVVFQGGDGICFELCESRSLQPSSLLANTHLSLVDLMRLTLCPIGTLAFVTPDGPSFAKVAAHVRTELLGSVGGAAVLRSLQLPHPPQRICEKDFNQYTDHMQQITGNISSASTFAAAALRVALAADQNSGPAGGATLQHEVAAEMSDGESTTCHSASSLASCQSDANYS